MTLKNLQLIKNSEVTSSLNLAAPSGDHERSI